MHSITMDQSPDVTMESDQNNNNENSSNNNLSIKKNEKYSLRQRGQRKSITSKQSKTASGGNSRSKANLNNSTNDESTALTTVTEKVAKEKPKQRAAPLSKYRRKTANARERTRMREINHAFETLRQSVPVIVAGSQAQSTNEKLTKITTLRMAMKYIKILSDILDNKTEVSDNLLASIMEFDGINERKDKPTSALLPAIVVNVNNRNSKEKLSVPGGNVLAQNHHDYCKEIIRDSIVKPVKSAKMTSKKSVKANNAKTKKPTSKSHSKAQKNSIKHQPLAPPIISRNQRQIHQSLNNHDAKFINQLLGGNFNQTMLQSNNINNNSLNCLSKYDLSPCLTPPNDDSPADLGLILESDGESLQLSEPCFSPLELGLLGLESDGESLHLSEPCLSPLNHLDALNSFNDLLHGGFSEHNSLEMYLS
ncbi:CLUMA_CG015122, isoform A [Clunio marinus]|uniref:CLUMA_CG015122, isoform A n=1 Tax=Clunio marinus TaxID=568069 RepID=A0A1J1IPE3_9DIPT|nr:CLUMA_CG015122, isoform A [Clunio marinus]